MGIVRFMKKENWISSCFCLGELLQLNLNLFTKKKKGGLWTTKHQPNFFFLLFFLILSGLKIMSYGNGRADYNDV